MQREPLNASRWFSLPAAYRTGVAVLIVLALSFFVQQLKRCGLDSWAWALIFVPVGFLLSWWPLLLVVAGFFVGGLVGNRISRYVQVVPILAALAACISVAIIVATVSTEYCSPP
jgi:hypothetical protein